MAKHQHVLALGFGEEFDALAGRLLIMNFRAVRATSTEDGLRALTRAAEPIRAALLSVPHRLGDLSLAAGRLRDQAGASALRFVAVGDRPNRWDMEELGKAGVEFGLWRPFDHAALRFVLNQAIRAPSRAEARNELRAPTTMVARVFSKAGPKAALVYNLSAGGAFLETQRPTAVTGHVRVELPLPDGTLTLDAVVVTTNVPGNVQKPNLPMGMGVKFVGVTDDMRRVLAEHVEALASAFRIDKADPV